MEKPPTSEEREKCWKSRDLYYDCLDGNNNEKEKCLIYFKKFQFDCLPSWVIIK